MTGPAVDWDPVAAASPPSRQRRHLVTRLRRCPPGVIPSGPQTPITRPVAAPANQPQDTSRDETQNDTLLASRNRKRPSGRLPIFRALGDTVPWLPCYPVVSIDGPDGHPRRLAVVVESSVHYPPNSEGSMGSGFRGVFHGVWLSARRLWVWLSDVLRCGVVPPPMASY